MVYNLSESSISVVRRTIKCEASAAQAAMAPLKLRIFGDLGLLEGQRAWGNC